MIQLSICTRHTLTEATPTNMDNTIFMREILVYVQSACSVSMKIDFPFEVNLVFKFLLDILGSYKICLVYF